MTELERKAWDLYCELSAGALSARDYWDQLSDRDKERYKSIVSKED